MFCWQHVAFRISVAAFLGHAAAGCAGSQPRPRSAPSEGSELPSPLGPSYVLMPVPSDDEDLLGRILPSAPVPGHAMEDTLQPNPCMEKLEPARTTPLVASFQDADELAIGARAAMVLQTFGFEADIQRATHFSYKLDTEKRIARPSTADYLACCKEKECGYGYISALIYGTGQYATLDETSASAKGSVWIATAEGSMRGSVLHRRNVRGWVAAMVTRSAQSAPNQDLSVLGFDKSVGYQPLSAKAEVESIYEPQRLWIDRSKASGYTITGAKGAITENEFVRRFRATTGSDELDDLERGRTKTLLVVSGVGTAVGLSALIWGLSRSRSCRASDADVDASQYDNCSTTPAQTASAQCAATDANGTCRSWYDPGAHTRDTERIWVGALGGTVAVISGAFMLVGFLKLDGYEQDHYLMRYEAELYVKRYNRIVLREAIREVEAGQRPAATIPTQPQTTRPRPAAIQPVLGLGTIGIGGSF